ncbi:hypothetical protein Patl1_18501 [Pistacia atlantica]|uniref:Uncharacterized protein n=1 Tax=Pistacia atlantica TaxID=434234 RepID=A0ACC1C2R4_9ROSI|nr:hypothetical protein Patl1_18501 [Pistacia atlantica]
MRVFLQNVKKRRILQTMIISSEFCGLSSGSTDTTNMSEVEKTKSRSEQRYPVPGEPACVVCGKYGEYICNETDDDICSLECKAAVLRSLEIAEEPSIKQNPDVSSSGNAGALQVAEFEKDFWDYNRNRWSKKRSSLCTYQCWKCKRPGHFAEDCLVMTSNQVHYYVTSAYRWLQSGINPIPLTKDLLELYRRKISFACNLNLTTVVPPDQQNLISIKVQCMLQLLKFGLLALTAILSFVTEWGTRVVLKKLLFDDGCAGHLNEHIRTKSSHQKYYSHKLKRLVKCCKSTCKVTEITDLLVCHYCFSKAFDKYKDMYSATWKGAGLQIIWNSICCEDHFEWHRVNCLNADVEDRAYITGSSAKKEKLVQLSDCIF